MFDLDGCVFFFYILVFLALIGFGSLVYYFVKFIFSFL